MAAEVGVDCRRTEQELDRRFEGMPGEISDAARLHLATCPQCHHLYGWMVDGTVEKAPAELTFRIQSQLRASLHPVKPLPRIGICFAGFLAAFAILAGAATGVMGTAGLDRMSVSQLILVSILFAAGAVLCAFLLTKQLAPAVRQAISTPLAVFLFGMAALTGTMLWFPWRTPGAAIDLSWQCLLREFAIAGPTAVLLWFAVRRGAILSATAKGATIGAMAGLAGVTALQFGCVYQQALHLLLWHWSGMAIAAATGALIGRVRGSRTLLISPRLSTNPLSSGE